MTHDQLIYRDRNAIVFWLALCVLLVASMVLVGGYTRLSGSGLSITSWKPIHGVLPPLNETQWAEEFAAYQQSPQYQKINSGMALDDFKTIFWPEFLHRLLGRVIGAVFFLPLAIFAIRKSIMRRFGWRLAGIFALGGLQGLIGWLMVKSGLVDDPHVSHLRLALHLSIAFAILGMLLWSLLDLLFPLEGGAAENKRKARSSKRGGDTLAAIHLQHHPLPNPPPSRGREYYSLWFTLLCFQIIFGAFMAGLHAGLIYNTWPDMNGQMIPDGLTAETPWYDSIVMVQFLHRTTAILVVFGFLFWWHHYRAYVKNNGLGGVCARIAAIIGFQFLLGVLTLINAVPLHLALTHQMTALLLFAASVELLYKLSSSAAHSAVGDLIQTE